MCEVALANNSKLFSEVHLDGFQYVFIYFYCDVINFK